MPHATYQPEKMGAAVIEPIGSFEAGSYQSFTLTFTAGFYGIDDTGSLKIVHRFASDMGRPQFDDPKAPNYVNVEASNNAVLQVEYDIKRNIRPWDKTIYVKIVRGFLSEGDQIILHFGDRRKGSPGMRLQTFCEDTFEFRVLVDAFATYNYVELPQQPAITIVPGKPVLWKAVLPTARRKGEPFRICLKGEDKWGNPSNRCKQTFLLRPSCHVEGLPERVIFTTGEFSVIIGNLSVNKCGDVTVDLLAEDESFIASSNPLRILKSADLLPYWGDLHGQSQETIGTNTARDYHAFARDRAFLDATSHQGNDFQITRAFWNQLNDITAKFNEDNRFITFPGYEWSGNTGLGGDRNILYMNEGRPGASHPGAAKFGSYGGLTCLLAPELTRAGLVEALRKRHHYATTGCRMVLDTRACFDTTAELFAEDPNLEPTTSRPVQEAIMGDILRSGDAEVGFLIKAHASAPIERIDICNGLDTLETFRPYTQVDLGCRIRVIWEGSEYRGRGRETNWDGSAILEKNSFERIRPINRYNLDKKFDLPTPGKLQWTSLTTGGHGGFEALLADPQSGTLRLETDLVKAKIFINEIGYDDLVFEAGGLGRRIRVFRLPDENPHRTIRIERRIAPIDGRDNALYVRLTQEDGHVVWSSPIYILR